MSKNHKKTMPNPSMQREEKMENSNMFDMFKKMGAAMNPEKMKEMQRRNMETMQKAGSITKEMLQHIGEMQRNYMKSNMSDMSSQMKNMMMMKSPEDYQNMMSQMGHMMGSKMRQGMENAKSASEKMMSSSKQMADMMTKRFSDGLEEIRSMMSSIQK